MLYPFLLKTGHLEYYNVTTPEIRFSLPTQGLLLMLDVVVDCLVTFLIVFVKSVLIVMCGL